MKKMRIATTHMPVKEWPELRHTLAHLYNAIEGCLEATGVVDRETKHRLIREATADLVAIRNVVFLQADEDDHHQQAVDAAVESRHPMVSLKTPEDPADGSQMHEETEEEATDEEEVAAVRRSAEAWMRKCSAFQDENLRMQKESLDHREHTIKMDQRNNELDSANAVLFAENRDLLVKNEGLRIDFQEARNKVANLRNFLEDEL
jgi:hypothetical protein